MRKPAPSLTLLVLAGLVLAGTLVPLPAAAVPAVVDNGSTITIYSPKDPVLGRREYQCVIPKRFAETTNRAIRSGLLQIACGTRPGAIRAGAVVQMWSSGSATATNGTSGAWDYNFYHSEIWIKPNDTSRRHLSFRINDDQTVEGNEYFQFTLKWSTKLGWKPFWVTLNESVHTVTVWIDDDDTYSLTVSPESAAESGGAKTVTVTAAVAGGTLLGEARTIDVQVGAAADHAVEGTDYQNVGNFNVTIPKGSNKGTGTFTLTPIDDAHLEAGERITVSGSGYTRINGHKLRPRVTGSGLWLTDSETITLSATPDVDEGGGAQTVTVTATASGTAQRAIPLTISVGKSGDAAVSGTDYAAVSDFTLTIPSGSKTGTATFQLTPINDTTQESDETLSIAGSAGSHGLSSAIADTSVKILDNDVLLSLSPASTGEEAGAKTVTVTARAKTARTASRALTVSVGRIGDSAVSGTDYGAVTDFSLTIAANQASGTATFTFTPRDDTIIEGSEAITVHATGTGVDVNSATLTLTETDTTDFVISLNPGTVAEGVNWRNLVVTISTTDGYTVSQTVTCQFRNGGGSATWGGDYQIHLNNKWISPPGTPGSGVIPALTIDPGKTSGSRTVRLRTISDSTAEGDETVQIKGYTPYPNLYKSCKSSGNPRTVDSEPYPADLTITDDDGSISLSASPGYVWENTPANVEVTATLPGTLAAPEDTLVTVSVGKSGDAAVEGTDYTAVDDFFIQIPKGNRSAKHTFWFSPIDDDLAEGTEEVSIDGTADKFSVSGTTLDLDDDEALKLTLSASPDKVKEDAGATAVTVTAALGGSVTYDSAKTVTVRVGTSSDSATEGTDYATVANFSFTIPANQSSGTGTFTLTPTHDTTPESDESISVTGYSPGFTVKGTSITLKDVGVPITLSASPSSVTEDGGAKTVTVTATNSKAATSDIALTIAVGKSGDSATSGTDYAAVDDFTLTIKKDATTGTGTFTLTPVDDDLYEGASESLTISGSATGYKVSDTSVAITDDDASAKASVSLSVKPTRVKECSAATTVTVTATLPDDVYSLPEARDVTISVGESGDTATSGTDYKAVDDFTLTIPAGHHNGLATFELEPVDDSTQEGDETITVSGTATRLAVGNDAEVTIEDDDQPIIVLTMDPATIPENDKSTSVKVTASMWDSAADRCPADTPGSGGAGGAGGGAVKMSAASMAATAGSMVGASAAEVARAVLGPGARPASQQSDQTVTVTIGDTGDTAVSGTDYTAVSDFTIVIKGGQTKGSATFTTTASLDNILEPTETLTAKGAATGTTVTPAGGNVDDKDQVAPTLTVSPTKVAENAAATSVTVTVTTGGVTVAEAVEVDFKVSGGTATAGTDFAKVKDFELTLAAGTSSATGTFTLTPTDDTIVEGDETLNVSIPDTTLSAAVTLTDNDSTDLTLTASPSSVAEGDSAKTVTVTAATDGDTFPADRTVTVTVGGSKDGATPMTDYDAVDSFDIVLKTGKTSVSGTFTLTPKQDTVIEGDETISVTGTSTGLTVNGTSVKITDDDDTEITLRVSPPSVAEGDEATEVTVTAATDGDTFAADRKVTVSVGGSTDSATSGTDYAAVADLDVTIKAGKTSGSGTFTLTPKQDTLVEGEEAIGVTGTSTGLTVNGTSVKITDDDTAPEVNLTVSPSSVAEDASATTVTVTAAFSNTSTYGAAKTVSVTVGESTDSATSGTDYAAVTGFDVTIAAGAGSGTGTFTLTPTGDRIVEGDEKISVDGTSTGLTVNGTEVTITDDDSTEITLTASPTSVSESDLATSVTVTAATDGDTFPADKTISVTVGESTDSATSGTDYAAVAGFDVTIKSGETKGTGTFTLTPTSDTLVEGNETISVDGTSTGLTVNDTSVTLTDDDSAPVVNLTASLAGKTSISEAASATTVTVTAKFSNTSTYATDTTIAVTVGDSADSATSGTDYAAVTGFDVTIAAGKTSGTGTFTLTPTDDTLVEGNETISVQGTYTGLTVNDAGVTITDDDGAPVINLSVNPSSVAESASATTVTVTAQFSNSSTYGAAKTVSVTVGDSTDSAKSGTDYAAVTGFDVTIAAGKTSGTATFKLTPDDDTLIEGNETITVAGTNADLTVNGTSVTLTDDDGTPAVNLSVNPSSVAESASGTTVTVTAQFSNSSTYGVAKTVSVTVGDSGDSAASGTDYAAVTGFDVTIAAGKTSGTGTFTLTPTNDTLVEGNETISVDGASTGLTVNGTSLTLTDDDTPPAIDLSASPPSVAEDASATTVTVTAQFSNSSTYGAAKTVTVTVGDSGDSAKSGTDYAAVTDFDVTVAAGKTSGTATFTLTPTDDTLVEGDETISVDGTSDLTVNGTSVTLSDDDATEITLTVSPSSVKEGDSATTVTVTAATDGDTFPADRTVRVKIGKAGDGATSGTDYAAVSAFDVTLTAGKTSGTGTFTLTITDDNIIEGDESVTVSGTSTGLTVNGASVTIEDNEKPTIDLDIKPFLNTDPDKLPEDAGATRVTVTAGTKGGVFDLDRQVHVTVGKDGDSAVFGDGKDYDTPSQSFHVTIKANKTKAETTFTLTPNDDVIVEGDESLTLVGSATVDWLEVTEATITIEDNDVPGMSLTASPASVAENDAATDVTVTAATGGVTFTAARTVAVTVGKSGDSATSGTDYAAVTGFDVTITAGQTSGTGTFTLTPTDDTLIEGDETITVAGTTTGYTVSDASVTLTDDEDAEITLTASPASVAENAGATTVTVTAATGGGTFTAARTVTVSVGDTEDSAASGTDYAAVSDFAITIATGKSSGTGTFTLTPTDDTEIEGDETITVAGASTGYTVSGTSVTLTDDDATDLTLTAAPASVAEDAGATTVTVTAATDGDTFKTDRAVTVSVGDTEDSAASGTDYAAVSDFTITIAAGQSSGTGTFTLTPTDDTLMEGDEAITVSGTSTGLTVTGTSVTITDDDNPGLTLTADPSSVAETAGSDEGDGDREDRRGDVPCRPDGDGNGRRQQGQRDGNDGLHRGGEKLRHHDHGGREQRHGHVHADAGGRQPDRGRRDDRRGRHVGGSARRRADVGDADRRRQPRHAGGPRRAACSADDRPDGESVQRGRERGGHVGDGDRDGGRRQGVSGGGDDRRERGRRHGDIGDGLRGGERLHDHDRGRADQRQRGVHADADRRLPDGGGRDDRHRRHGARGGGARHGRESDRRRLHRDRDAGGPGGPQRGGRADAGDGDGAADLGAGEVSARQDDRGERVRQRGGAGGGLRSGGGVQHHDTGGGSRGEPHVHAGAGGRPGGGDRRADHGGRGAGGDGGRRGRDDGGGGACGGAAAGGAGGRRFRGIDGGGRGRRSRRSGGAGIGRPGAEPGGACGGRGGAGGPGGVVRRRRDEGGAEGGPAGGSRERRRAADDGDGDGARRRVCDAPYGGGERGCRRGQRGGGRGLRAGGGLRDRDSGLRDGGGRALHAGADRRPGAGGRGGDHGLGHAAGQAGGAGHGDGDRRRHASGAGAVRAGDGVDPAGVHACVDGERAGDGAGVRRGAACGRGRRAAGGGRGAVRERGGAERGRDDAGGGAVGCGGGGAGGRRCGRRGRRCARAGSSGGVGRRRLSARRRRRRGAVGRTDVGSARRSGRASGGRLHGGRGAVVVGGDGAVRRRRGRAGGGRDVPEPSGERAPVPVLERGGRVERVGDGRPRRGGDRDRRRGGREARERRLGGDGGGGRQRAAGRRRGAGGRRSGGAGPEERRVADAAPGGRRRVSDRRCGGGDAPGEAVACGDAGV